MSHQVAAERSTGNAEESKTQGGGKSLKIYLAGKMSQLKIGDDISCCKDLRNRDDSACSKDKSSQDQKRFILL